MRIHAIKTGVVSVKSRQRQGMGGIARRLNTLLDNTWTEWLPIYCWVIEHPEGIIVIDTGETSRAANPTYFPRWHPYFRFGVKINVDPEQEVGPQIKKLGLSLSDVRWVVMTHLHTDHIGGAYHFPKSEFLVSRREYTSSTGMMGKLRGYIPHRLPDWFEPRLLDYSTGNFGSFEQGFVLTKSEDVLVVPTPGHTLSHQSVILRDEDVTYMFAGDTSYTEGLMVGRVVDGVSPKAHLAKETLNRIHKFLDSEPVIYLPSHDPLSTERLIHKVTTNTGLR